MTTGTPTRPFPATGTSSRGGRQALIDFGLGVRLALRSGRTGGLRLALTAVGVGLCVAVLLLGASLDRAQEHRQARSEALNPGVSFEQNPPPGAATFVARPFTQTYDGLLIKGMDVVALDPGATAPPGVTAFPEPGALVVSPALAHLLSTPRGDQLRPRFTEAITEIIGDDGLTSPSDLRFYRGARTVVAGDLNPIDPATAVVAWSWGGQDWSGDGTTPDRFQRVAVVTGAAVVLVPLLIFVSLMSRLGTAARNRRTSALRAIGATASQLRRVQAGETLVGAVTGVVVGVLGFFAIRRADWLRVGGNSFFPSDITPPFLLAAAVVIGVPTLASATVLLGSQPVSVMWGHERLAPVGARLTITLAVGALVAVQMISSPSIFGEASLIVVAATVLVLLLLVPLLLPLLLAVAVCFLPLTGVPGRLATRRIGQDVGTSARSVAGVPVVTAAAISMVVMMSFAAATSANSRRAGDDPHQYRVQVDAASSAELSDIRARLSNVPGVQSITTGSYVAANTAAGTYDFMILVADCGELISAGVPDCEDGDVFRARDRGLTAEGVPLTVEPGDVVRFGSSITTTIQWTVPAVIDRDLSPLSDVIPPELAVTPGSLGGQLESVLADSFAIAVVDTDRTDAVDDLRNVLAPFSSRATVTSPTEWAADSGRMQLTSTLQTGLILGGGLTLAVALAGLLVVAIEQLVGRRRALTLTVAAGVPRSVLARSVLVGALITGTTGALLGTAVGLLLAWYVSSILFTAMSLHVASVLAIAGDAVLATVLVTASTLPALSSLTRLESLRTE